MAEAGKVRFQLNSANFDQWSQLAAIHIHDAALRIQENLEKKLPEGVPTDVRFLNGDDGRPVALVAIAHPSGAARQAKHGSLTRAAAEAGLEVTRWKEG